MDLYVEKMIRSLISLCLLENAIILLFGVCHLHLGDNTKSHFFDFIIIIISLLGLLNSLIIGLPVLHKIRQMEGEAVKEEEEKKEDDSKEKKKCNDLQDEANDIGDKADIDLSPTIHIHVAEHEAILNEKKIKWEDDIKNAVDKCKKEMKEKAKRKKSKYQEEKAKWEKERYNFAAEIGRLGHYQKMIQSITSSYHYQYGTNPHGTYQYGLNHSGTNQHETYQYSTNPYGANQYGTNQYGTNQYGTNQYGANQYGTNQYGINPFGANASSTNQNGTSQYDSNPGYSMPGGMLPVPCPGLSTALVNAPIEQRRTMLGENLYPLVDQIEHEHVDKVTEMLLEMDTTEVLHLLESPDQLKAKVAEAMEVLRQEKLYNFANEVA